MVIDYSAVAEATFDCARLYLRVSLIDGGQAPAWARPVITPDTHCCAAVFVDIHSFIAEISCPAAVIFISAPG